MEEARQVLHQQRILDLVTVTARGQGALELGWNIVGSRVYLDGVVIQYRQSSRRYDQLQTITLSDSRANGHTIRNLEGGTEYDVFIQPFYRSVVGLPSSIKHIKTKTEQIVRKTEILVADMINVTTAFIVWQPKQPSSGVTGYQVRTCLSQFTEKQEQVNRIVFCCIVAELGLIAFFRDYRLF